METTSPKTILLVEDDKALNAAVSFRLKQKGHHVISTVQADKALSILESQHANINIVWLDLLLPGMNGMDFLAKVRKNNDYKDLKIAICSVSGREDTKSVARSLGVVDYLVKSDYEIDTLVEKVLSYT